MIEVILKCQCADGEAKLLVRERGEDEDILDWMEHVKAQVGDWHRERECPSSELEYMKIPIPDRPGARIGDRS